MIIPAIIADNQCQLDNAISKVKDIVPLIHLDIMDNTFVPNTSLDFDFYLPNTTSQFEAHLMINNPLPWIKSNWWKVDTVIFHIETCSSPQLIIDYLKDFNIKCGIAISISSLHIPSIEFDQITLLTVEPGFYGSKFLPYVLPFAPHLKKAYPSTPIEVDGGVTPTTLPFIKRYPVDMFVSGSYIMKSNNIPQAINDLQGRE